MPKNILEALLLRVKGLGSQMFVEKWSKSFKIVIILKKGQKSKMHAPEFKSKFVVICMVWQYFDNLSEGGNFPS